MKFLKNLFGLGPKPTPTTTPVPKATLAILTVSAIPKFGDKSADVKTLQVRLTALGFQTTADGDFGEKTKASVASFQKSKNLLGSGVIGVRTMEYLGLTLPAPAPAPAPAPLPVPATLPSHDTEAKGRSLEKELELLMDKTALNLFGQDLLNAIARKDGNLLVWMGNKSLLALQVREATNNNDGKMVVLIQSTIGTAVKEAWCMAQQQSCIAWAERKTGLTSKVIPSESVMTTATSSKANHVSLANLQRGDLICWQHGTGWTGHTGCFDTWANKMVSYKVIEGNTTSGSEDGSSVIVREGGGTYLCTRIVGKIGDMTVKAYVRPFVS